MLWQEIGTGSYNIAYKNADSTEVFKVPYSCHLFIVDTITCKMVAVDLAKSRKKCLIYAKDTKKLDFLDYSVNKFKQIEPGLYPISRFKTLMPVINKMIHDSKTCQPLNYIHIENLIQKDEQKKMFPSQSPTEQPDRAIRVWNEINDQLPFEAKKHVDPEHGEGWICPYVDGKKSTDKEIPVGVLNIYKKTGRIVIDAISDNFKTTPSGAVVCIDTNFALELENRPEFKKRHSQASLLKMKDRTGRNHYFNKHESKYPESINTVKALLFLKQFAPDHRDVDFLLKDTALRNELAKAYNGMGSGYSFFALKRGSIEEDLCKRLENILIESSESTKNLK